MEAWSRQFNIYLALAATLALLCGCQTNKPHGPIAALRVHIEAAPSSAGMTQTISVLRADPVVVTILQQPLLTEANLVAAGIIDTPGGFAIVARFDENGTWMLEQYSAANTGLHFAIYGQWGKNLTDGRWLAAPLIAHRIANGVLAFTPDMSRPEAEQFALGLSNTARFYNQQFK